jgi:hypothetical protein
MEDAGPAPHLHLRWESALPIRADLLPGPPSGVGTTKMVHPQGRRLALERAAAVIKRRVLAAFSMTFNYWPATISRNASASSRNRVDRQAPV